MFFRKLLGLGANASSVSSHRPTAKLPLGRRSLRLEPLEDRRMLSVLFVDDDSTAATPDGLAWATAYTDLQSALDRAAELNTDAIPENNVESIWIAEGTYYPTAELEPTDVWSATFSLLDGVSLYGGFAGNEIALSQRDLSAHTTILSGDLGVLGDNSDNAYTVVYCDVETTVDGVTIRDGNANNPEVYTHFGGDYGGGIYNQGTLTIRNCRVTANRAYYGAGIYNDGELFLENSTLMNNFAEYNGGGVGNWDGTLTVTSSTIADNVAMSIGGGIDLYYGELHFINSTLSGNSAAWGGGIYGLGAMSFKNSTITENSAENGGGVYCYDVNSNPEASGPPTTATLHNTIVAENKAPYGPDIFLHSGTLSGSKNLIGDGTDQTLVHGANGNLVGTTASPVDPMLSELSQFGNGQWGHYLLPGSPALNAGNNAMATGASGEPLTEDIRGNARIVNGVVDIGATEGATSGSAARTYIVTSLANEIVDDGILTFIEAFQAANRNRPVGDAPAGSFLAQDTILFDNGLFAGGAKTILVDDGELAIVGDLRIEGPDMNRLAFDAGYQSGLFFVSPGASVDLSGMSIAYGYDDYGGGIFNAGELTLTDTSIFNCAAYSGGAIFNHYGQLTILECDLNSNAADQGGGIYNIGFDSSQALNIHDTILSYNETTWEGGAIYNYRDTMNLTGCVIAYNTSDTDGGGIFNDGENGFAASILDGCVLSDNSANNGGGIFNYASDGTTTLTLTNSSIWGNDATNDGGGICNYSYIEGNAVVNITGSIISSNFANLGGGIDNSAYDESAATVTISNSTISSNTASEDGGAITNYGFSDYGDAYSSGVASLTLINSTLSYNLAGDTGGGVFNGGYLGTSHNSSVMTMHNTIVADNFDGIMGISGGPDIYSNSATLSGSHNLIGNGKGQTLVHGIDDNLVGLEMLPIDPGFVDPAAGDFRLLIQSPAMDAGDNTWAVDPGGAPLTMDLEGNPRIQNGTVDMGAFETTYTDGRLGPILYVDDDAMFDNPNPTSGWEYAYDDLQSALDRATLLNSDGITGNDVTQIWIAEGFYYPTKRFEEGNPRSAMFELCDNVTIYGGFAGTETNVEERDLLYLHQTILSGDLGVIEDIADNAYTVVSCDPWVTATLDGVIVAYANSDDQSDPSHAIKRQGGGIFTSGNLTVKNSTIFGNRAICAGGILNSEGTLSLQDVTIRENEAIDSDGGGIFNARGTVTLNRVDIIQNSATKSGGGIANDNGIVTMENTMLKENQSDITGGGLGNFSGQVFIKRSRIIENTAATAGGGIANTDGTMFLESVSMLENSSTHGGAILSEMGAFYALNSLIIRNQADYAGGILSYTGTVEIINTTITHNSATAAGGGIMNGDCNTTIDNSIVALNVATAGNDLYQNTSFPNGKISGSHNLIGDGSGQTRLINGINGNQVGTSGAPLDPKFVAPEGWDYRLMANSSAINAGSNALAMDPWGAPLDGDITGNPRIQNGTVDIGTYEYGASEWGSMHLILRNREGTEQLTWIDEWSECWVEIWAQGSATTGIVGFDLKLEFMADCFMPDMTKVLPGPKINEEVFSVVLDESEETLGLTGGTYSTGVNKESEILLAKVYFQPTPGESVLPRDTEGRYLSPVVDNGFHIEQANLFQEGNAAICSIAIQEHDIVPLWPVMYDLNRDGIIDLDDASLLLSVFRWNVEYSNSPNVWAADFDRSGIVDLNDFSAMLARFRWQKGDGNTLSYPGAFPFGEGYDMTAASIGGIAALQTGTMSCEFTSRTVPILPLTLNAVDPTPSETSTQTYDATSTQSTRSYTDAVLSNADSWTEADWAGVAKDLDHAEKDDSIWSDEKLIDLNLDVLGDLK